MYFLYFLFRYYKLSLKLPCNFSTTFYVLFLQSSLKIDLHSYLMRLCVPLRLQSSRLYHWLPLYFYAFDQRSAATKNKLILSWSLRKRKPIFSCVLDYLLSLVDSRRFQSHKRVKDNSYVVQITDLSFSQCKTFIYKMSVKHIKM